MHHAVHAVRSLLAQSDRFRDMSRAFRGRRAQWDSGDVMVALAVLGAVVVGLWLLWHFGARSVRARKRNGPLRLFLELCRAHKLRWADRWLLWRLARAGRLRDPALLFLDPERLDAPRLPASLRGRAALFDRLKTRLFAEPPDASNEEGPAKAQ
jgi:hypothetical protein